MQTLQVNYPDIQKIIIKRTTPFYKDSLSENKITWREKVIIDNLASLPGLYFGNLELLVKAIKDKNPQVKVTTEIATIRDNVEKTLG